MRIALKTKDCSISNFVLNQSEFTEFLLCKSPFSREILNKSFTQYNDNNQLFKFAGIDGVIMQRSHSSYLDSEKLKKDLLSDSTETWLTSIKKVVCFCSNRG